MPKSAKDTFFFFIFEIWVGTSMYLLKRLKSLIEHIPLMSCPYPRPSVPPDTYRHWIYWSSFQAKEFFEFVVYCLLYLVPKVACRKVVMPCTKKVALMSLEMTETSSLIQRSWDKISGRTISPENIDRKSCVNKNRVTWITSMNV